LARNHAEHLSREEVLAHYTAGPRTGIFTDGSCEPNPGPGGWGFVWVEEGEILQEKCGHDPDTTNNRMELMAIIEALETLPADGVFSVYSDSQLCVRTVNEWAAGWEKRGWKRKTGPIKNLDLVKRLWALAQAKPDVDLKWIKAHDGSRWNEYADALASSWSR
jgi:ribonuclease HI